MWALGWTDGGRILMVLPASATKVASFATYATGRMITESDRILMELERDFGPLGEPIAGLWP